MPMLRELRNCYAKFLTISRDMDVSDEGPGMLLAKATVESQLRASHAFYGEILDLLERTPPNWRPR